MSYKVLVKRNQSNILTDKTVKIPDWWGEKVRPSTQGPKKMTQRILKEQRKTECIPDISYDLDGDGFVGGKDYVIAKRFDKDHKMYLTKDER